MNCRNQEFQNSNFRSFLQRSKIIMSATFAISPLSKQLFANRLKNWNTQSIEKASNLQRKPQIRSGNQETLNLKKQNHRNLWIAGIKKFRPANFEKLLRSKLMCLRSLRFPLSLTNSFPNRLKNWRIQEIENASNLQNETTNQLV